MDQKEQAQVLCPLACTLRNNSGWNDFSRMDEKFDLKKIFVLFWQEKVVIIVFTLLCALGATAIALVQPKVYEVSAQIRLTVPKKDAGQKGLNVLNGIEHSELSLALGKGNPWLINAKAQGSDPGTLYEGFKERLSNFSREYQAVLVQEYLVEVDLLEGLLADSHLVGQTRMILEKKLAQNLYSLARYKNSNITVMNIARKPVFPTALVKPKIPLIIALGIVFGAMCGAGFVVIRHVFSQQD